MGSIAVSALMGLVVGLGMAALTGIGALRLRRGGVRTERTLFALGPALRMTGAIAGIAAGVAMGPPSLTGFVFSFLIAYLGAQALLVFYLRV